MSNTGTLKIHFNPPYVFAGSVIQHTRLSNQPLPNQADNPRSKLISPVPTSVFRERGEGLLELFEAGR